MAVKAVWESFEEPPLRWLSAAEILAEIGDDQHAWHGLSMVDRLGSMGVCLSGLVSSPRTPGLHEAYRVLALEGMSEQFGVLPEPGGLLDQDPLTLEAFSVIRAARNQVQDRRMKQAEDRAKGGR